MNEIVLGLDVGVASVGWSIIEKETGEIVELGSRLFNSADASENENRRNSRGARRLTRRKKHRRGRVKDLLEDAGFYFQGNNLDENPYAIRVKGLSEKLTESEVFTALYHIIKRRGISYLEDVEEEKGIKVDSLKRNAEELKAKCPAEIQLERFEKYGKVRGIIEVTEGDSQKSLVNIFPTFAYKKEAEKILHTQAKYYSQIDQQFMDTYMHLLVNKRPYYIGPGNEKSRTDYGVYRINGENWDNLFEVLIGKCSVYPNELRAAKASYTAQEFNVLNDLNNITIKTLESGKLSKAQKEDIIEIIKQSKSVAMLNVISKYIGCDKDAIQGFCVDKNQKPEFHTFGIYRKIEKALQEACIVKQFSREEYDKLAHILTINTEASEIRVRMKEKFPTMEEDIITILVQLNKKGLFSGWHSLSLKAMQQMLPELYETSKNQMHIIQEWGIQKNKYEKFKELKFIPEEMLLQDIHNPIATRSIRQSIKIINAIIKKYSEKYLDSIVIEMPRSYISSNDEKREITKMQKKNEKEKKDAINRAKSEYLFDDIVFHNHQKLDIKLRLWYQQNQRCVYSGKIIKVVDLVTMPNAFNIDHIIPESISYDDSLNNKVLCYAEENRLKGQRTPYQYLKSKAGDWNYKQFKSYISKLHADRNITPNKHNLFLMEEDINKWEVRQKFIARNLVDTRYASRVLLNGLQNFFVAHGCKTKVKVVRGKFTAQLRRGWKIKKDRDESYNHHAIDATIIAASSRLKVWKKEKNLQKDEESGIIFDKVTGEVMPLETVSEKEYQEIATKNPYPNFRKQIYAILADMDPVKVKYSHMVSKKTNRKVSDATIYSTREVNGKDIVVGKITNIYDDESYEKFKKRYIKDKTQFLMYKHDMATFQILEAIIKTYPDAKNPFAAYKEEHGYIRKYNKKGNGAIIKNMKYLNETLGQHIDISTGTNKVLPKGKKIVLLKLTPYRSDVYKDMKTGRYTVIGIKYEMFTFNKEGYQLQHSKYVNFIKEQGITDKHVFCFSLYKDDVIEFGEDKRQLERHRFLSKNEGRKNNIEVKPIDKPRYEKRKMITITKKTKIFNKYNTDILGTIYKVENERDPRIIE